MPARVLVILLLSAQISIAQNPAKVKQLEKNINSAKSDSLRVIALGELAQYYYLFRLEAKADSILQRQITIAELSHSNELVLATLFGNSVTNISSWSSIQIFDRAIKFIEQGLLYAIEAGRDDYRALAYIRKAHLLRKRGQYNNAIQQVSLAFSAAETANSDSLRAILFLELGDIYREKRNVVDAYNNFSNALAIALQLNNIQLQSEIYHHLAELYQSLRYYKLAKDNLLNSLQLNQQHNNSIGILNDYIDLARFTDEREYFNKALYLADSLQSDYHILLSKKIMFAYYMVVEKNTHMALQYLETNTDLKQWYQNQGPATYNFTLGNIYKYSNRPDSAIYFYALAEPVMDSTFDVTTRRSVYKEMGECYVALNNNQKAIEYFEKALELAKRIGEFASLSNLTLQLSTLYAKTNDYQKAYTYNKDYMHFQDSLKVLTNDRNLVLLEVKKDEEYRQRIADELVKQQLRKKNIQYMLITIVISGMFVVMILLGMFPLSKVTIKIISFFAFICLFEFIVLLIDSFLHEITHGEPLKIWLIKIFLIALLVPLQHYLEKLVVRFLASRRLYEFRRRISLKQWWHTVKKPSPKTEDGFDADTAVL